MAELTVDRTYSEALFSAARDAGKAKEIGEEAFAVLDVFKENEELFRLLDFPGISKDEKKQVISNVFGGRISKELENFMYILIDNRRIGRYEQITREYGKLEDLEEGVSYGTVYSTCGLSDERVARIEEKLTGLLGKKARLRQETDRSLIGGIKILIDGKILDASLRERLDDIGSAIRY